MCGLCEQKYHGDVACALGWACWKTYVGRPETNSTRLMAINVLGMGLSAAENHEDALIVGEAEVSMRRRLGGSDYNLLMVQGNLAITYQRIGRLEEAANAFRDVYSGCLQLNGEEHEGTLVAGNNYAASLVHLQRFEEVKLVMRKIVPVAGRVFGENHEFLRKIRLQYAEALYADPAATLDDLREAVTTYEEIERTARRVLGEAHPLMRPIQGDLKRSRAALRARETPPTSKSQN